jgi:tetratricopeptide (TPR) repeat protein
MRRLRPLILSTPILLAACVSPGGLSASRGGSPFAPTGRYDIADAADGLIVGHRLMAAGEYELALKAYNRAIIEQGVTVDVIAAIGSADLHLGRLGQAEKLLRRATQMDATFVPAWNNLGVVLMEKGEYSEASSAFRTAFALDSGNTDSIRENLRVALAKMKNPAYDAGKTYNYTLVRRGTGEYLLLSKR